jgi:Na+/H+ antiporter NhaC
MKYLLLSRPHKIENKDRLQYLQVKMETSINNISRTSAHRHFKSIAVIALLTVLALAALGVGLFFFIGMQGSVSLSFGIIFCALCLIFLVALIYPLVTMRKRENKRAETQINNSLALVEKYLQEACSLSLANVENSSDIISVLGGVGNERR